MVGHTGIMNWTVEMVYVLNQSLLVAEMEFIREGETDRNTCGGRERERKCLFKAELGKPFVTSELM